MPATPYDIVSELRKVRRRRGELDKRARALVIRGRELGLSWRTIGAELGVNHETARRLVRTPEEDAQRRMASDDADRS